MGSGQKRPPDGDTNDFLEQLIVPITRPDLPEEGRDPLLAPWKAGRSCIGSVDEIQDEGRLECTTYRPTRYELLLIARHWANRILDIQLDWFYFRQSGSTGIRLEPALVRLGRIARVIGDAAVEEVVTAVEDEQRERMGEEHWRIFTEGMEEEMAAVADEMCRKLPDAAENTPTKGKA